MHFENCADIDGFPKLGHIFYPTEAIHQVNNRELNPSTYRMEGNFGAVKIWRIWRLTMNSPNFSHPNILVEKKIAKRASN